MAEEYDDRFKSEMTRMMETVILKLGEHDKRFDGLEGKVEENTNELISVNGALSSVKSELVSVKKEIRILSGQFTDVTQMVLKDNQRTTKLETEVEDLKGSIH